MPEPVLFEPYLHIFYNGVAEVWQYVEIFKRNQKAYLLPFYSNFNESH